MSDEDNAAVEEKANAKDDDPPKSKSQENVQSLIRGSIQQASIKLRRSCVSVAPPRWSAFRHFTLKGKLISSKVFQSLKNFGEGMACYIKRVFTLPLLRGDPISFVRPEDFDDAGNAIEKENEKEYEETMDMIEPACNYTEKTRDVFQTIIAERKEFAANKRRFAKDLDFSKLAPWNDSFLGHLEGTFQVFDSSGDDLVDFEEMSIMLCDYGDKTTPDDRRKVFASADPTGKGALSFVEFVTMFHSITVKSPDSHPSSIVESFRLIDRNMARIRGLDVVQQLQARKKLAILNNQLN